MRLLMTTQVIDPDHPILGFSHTWASKLAERVEKLYIVALSVGKHSLPENVKVYSLGREHGVNKIGKFFLFQRYVAPLILGRKVDGVFVQQTEINAILAAPYAKLMGTPIIIFKAHSKSLRTSLKIANILIDRALTSTEVAYPLDTPKKMVTGQGIDTDFFSPSPDKKENNPRRVIAVGRLSPIKNYELQIEAINILVNQRGRKNISYHIYGAPDPESYEKKMFEMVREYGITGYVHFEGATDFRNMPEIYKSCDVLIHSCDTESLDKVVLEAMACSKLAITSIQSYRSELKEYSDLLISRPNDAVDLADKIEGILSLPKNEYDKLGNNLRGIVIRHHNIDHFADQVVGVFKNLVSK